MTAVSSLCKAPRSWQGCARVDRAASTSARLVRLLEPGTETMARGCWRNGTISRASGSTTGAGLSLIGDAHQEQPLGRGGWPRNPPVFRLEDLANVGLGPVAPADVDE